MNTNTTIRVAIYVAVFFWAANAFPQTRREFADCLTSSRGDCVMRYGRSFAHKTENPALRAKLLSVIAFLDISDRRMEKGREEFSSALAATGKVEQPEARLSLFRFIAERQTAASLHKDSMGTLRHAFTVTRAAIEANPKYRKLIEQLLYRLPALAAHQREIGDAEGAWDSLRLASRTLKVSDLSLSGRNAILALTAAEFYQMGDLSEVGKINSRIRQNALKITDTNERIQALMQLTTSQLYLGAKSEASQTISVLLDSYENLPKSWPAEDSAKIRAIISYYLLWWIDDRFSPDANPQSSIKNADSHAPTSTEDGKTGIVCFREPNVPCLIHEMQSAMAIIKSRVSLMTSLALIHAQSGDQKFSRRVFDAALNKLKDVKDQSWRAMLLINIAKAQRQARLEADSKRSFDQAIGFAVKGLRSPRGPRPFSWDSYLLSIAEYLIEAGEQGLARKALESLQAEKLSSDNTVRSYFLTRTALLMSEAGNQEGADQIFRQARTYIETVEHPRARFNELLELANNEMQANSRPNFQQGARESILSAFRMTKHFTANNDPNGALALIAVYLLWTEDSRALADNETNRRLGLSELP